MVQRYNTFGLFCAMFWHKKFSLYLRYKKFVMMCHTSCALLFACLSINVDTTQNVNAPQHVNWQEIAMQTDRLVLVDYDEQYTILDSVLAGHRGKVIYVDFWASFCAPCLKCMPLSHKMREHYADKDVAFVYIAVSDRPERWRQASHEANLDNGECQSYFAVNSKQARFKNQKVYGALPRFMVFDKQGELVKDFAPWPMTKEIIREIDKLLKK